jgi:hypothetical protein
MGILRQAFLFAQGKVAAGQARVARRRHGISKKFLNFMSLLVINSLKLGINQFFETQILFYGY